MTLRTVGSLFAGIGGFDLAAHAHGLRTEWVVEWEDYPASVLAARFPHAHRYGDVRDVHHPPRVDVLTGGFPCQDLSHAGRGRGISGSRSGLWTEYARIIGEVQPELVLIENVPALLHRGMELVVENLRELGYGVEWDCLPAAAFGAPHLRDRVWIAAHKIGAPVIFGQPAALFPLPPAGAADLVGGDDAHDDDPIEAGWLRWPRAGWVDGDPLEVMPLQPLATIAAVRTGTRVPTPSATEPHLLGGSLDPHYLAARADGSDGVLERMIASFDLRGFFGTNLFPTPAAIDATSSHTGRADTQGRHSLALHHLANNGALEHATDADDAVRRNDLALAERRDAPLFPTPVSSDARDRRRTTTNGGNGPATGRKVGDADDTLLDRVRKLDAQRTEVFPTPTSRDRAGGDSPGEHHRAGGLALRAVAQRWPTPNARDGDNRGAGDPEARKASGHAVNLDDAVHPEAKQAGKGAKLNPDWVEWLMGFPIGWTDLTVDTTNLRAHPWAHGEPADVPRVTTRRDERGPRLKALGNALVPQAPAWLLARYAAATGTL